MQQHKLTKFSLRKSNLDSDKVPQIAHGQAGIVVRDLLKIFRPDHKAHSSRITCDSPGELTQSISPIEGAARALDKKSLLQIVEHVCWIVPSSAATTARWVTSICAFLINFESTGEKLAALWKVPASFSFIGAFRDDRPPPFVHNTESIFFLTYFTSPPPYIITNPAWQHLQLHALNQLLLSLFRCNIVVLLRSDLR
ncbi:hypothetical protein BU25DRAFT_198000, partial [Macroventuria anomochaeta]